jgi:outer membrane receptor protein involved in Fe transport
MHVFGSSARVSIALALSLAMPSFARAEPASQPASSRPASQPVSQPASSRPASQPVSQPASYRTTVRSHRPLHGRTPGRASTRVRRRELEERLPRSAPDALRYEPGVYVQQTAHGQGSAYIRGRTGQQTVILFDGIRLNNATFRQGPNQYFFTVDARTISSLQVRRGGASTRYGSDAIGGAIDARPRGPRADPQRGFDLRPGVMLRWGSADGEAGGRVELDAQLGERVALLGGVGYRRAGRLESGGRLDTPAVGNTPAGGWVPRFEDDGRTQLGTGFREWASDLRLVLALSDELRLTAAVYDYRQLDAPRTDKCPPAEAARGSCLLYDEQFRTLAYLSLRGRLGRLAASTHLALSYQNQHERRRDVRPAGAVENGGRDDVHSFGLLARFVTEGLMLGRGAAAPRLSLGYGGDLYHDRVASSAWTRFTDSGQVRGESRGQYVEGSHYTWAGAYAQPELALFGRRLLLRAGARIALSAASSPGDDASATRAVSQRWLTVVGHGGVEWRPLRGLSLLLSADRSYRAPNLDDLTSRQATGPGFQIENPDLAAESALTLEAGLRFERGPLQTELWGYWARLSDAIERQPLPLSRCPQTTGRSCLRLVNLSGAATIVGAELAARLFLPLRFTLRATLAWARGAGPNPSGETGSEVPLSRVPPLNGTAELRWRHRLGIYAGAALRWALAQDRLSLGDVADQRIPPGGTPGFAVFDLRAGYRLRRHLVLALVFENLGDAAYRYHGSSVNGPGRSVVLGLEGRL